MNHNPERALMLLTSDPDSADPGLLDELGELGGAGSPLVLTR
ncbi:hypothetical protein [Streptosporangium sp. NPDC023615]